MKNLERISKEGVKPVLDLNSTFKPNGQDVITSRQGASGSVDTFSHVLLGLIGLYIIHPNNTLISQSIPSSFLSVVVNLFLQSINA